MIADFDLPTSVKIPKFNLTQTVPLRFEGSSYTWDFIHRIGYITLPPNTTNGSYQIVREEFDYMWYNRTLQLMGDKVGPGRYRLRFVAFEFHSAGCETYSRFFDLVE
jgi:hypothetical protein